MITEYPGYNFVPTYYTIGSECYWENGRPVNEPYWRYFKELQDNKSSLVVYMGDKPIAFSVDMIRKTFNPVRHMVSNAVIRDSVFSFHSFIKSLGLDGWLMTVYDSDTDSFILHLPIHKYKKQIG